MGCRQSVSSSRGRGHHSSTFTVAELSTVFLKNGKTVRLLINEESPKDSFGLTPADVATIRADVGTLKKHDSTEVRVRRAGATVILPRSNVVPGDIVLLTGATPCPAHVRLLSVVAHDGTMTPEAIRAATAPMSEKEDIPKSRWRPRTMELNMRGAGDDLGFESAVGLVVMDRKQLYYLGVFK